MAGLGHTGLFFAEICAFLSVAMEDAFTPYCKYCYHCNFWSRSLQQGLLVLWVARHEMCLDMVH
jgi:hypothetical protein